jgi:hypothetical protein
LDLTVVVDTNHPVTSGVTTLTGDLTTAVANKQVWAENAGPKRLLRLDVVNGSATTSSPVIRASNSVLAGDTTVKILAPIAAAGNKSYFFGDGYSPFRFDAGTRREGCTIHIAEDGRYSDTPVAATDYYIRAIYE